MKTETATKLCPRTLALWKPGQPIPGIPCSYSYMGKVPGTGRLACHLCGRDKPKEESGNS